MKNKQKYRAVESADKFSIDIQVEPQLGELDTEPIRLAVLATLVYQEAVAPFGNGTPFRNGTQDWPQISLPCEVTVVISDDEALCELNRRFRGEDHPTDVLSFTNDTRGPCAGATGTFPFYLGDVVISIDRARVQAAEAGGTLTQELQLLAVHGILHLLGHDHENPGNRTRMWEIQSTILKALGVDIPLPE
ncbi:MAG: rRNA maturation RNase YbeY [Anaerolineae bacterium]|nr:rRNA maturation RNase YbeY [Anaerolineae bacterium]